MILGQQKSSQIIIVASNWHNLAQMSSANLRMEDTRVADRVLQTITEGNNATRTAAMMVQVDLDSSKAARNVWSETSEFLEMNRNRAQS